MLDLTHVRFQGMPNVRGRTDALRRTASCRKAHRETSACAPAAPHGAVSLPAAILARAGLDPGAYRPRPLARRVSACLRLTRAATEREALAQLAARPELLGAALRTVLIGVSSFFRDSLVFEALRGPVVEALGARAAPPRVLSIACATGAELYSVAMLLAEAGLLPGSQLLGVDCRGDALERAREGFYASAEIADVDAELRSRWLEPCASGWRVAEPLRSAARWQLADATREIPRGPWDLVLCRNLFIYLQPSVVETMLHRIETGLSPGGFLVVGKAEHPPAALGLVAIDRCVYRKHV